MLFYGITKLAWTNMGLVEVYSNEKFVIHKNVDAL